MTVHPIDTEALRAELEAAVVDYRSPNLDLAARVLSALTAAEHRIARLEAQSDIRGRAVVMYRDRARKAEARIKAVEDALSFADMGETLVTRSRIRRALDGEG